MYEVIQYGEFIGTYVSVAFALTRRAGRRHWCVSWTYWSSNKTPQTEDIMSLSDDLYALYKKADHQEAQEALRTREAEEIIRQRDELIVIAQRWEMPTPEAHCRNCDTTMHMVDWKNQYCYDCSPDL